MCSRPNSFMFLRKLILLTCIDSFSLLHFSLFLSRPPFLNLSLVIPSHLKATRLHFCISFSASILSTQVDSPSVSKLFPGSLGLFHHPIYSDLAFIPITVMRLPLLRLLLSSRFQFNGCFSVVFMSNVSKCV